MFFFIPVEKDLFCVRVMTAGLARHEKLSFLFLAQVATALISAMLFPTFVREETQQFFVILPTHLAQLEFGSSCWSSCTKIRLMT
jgi:hypothetical protein